MKRFLSGLWVCVLVGSAAAQTPLPQGTPTVMPVQPGMPQSYMVRPQAQSPVVHQLSAQDAAPAATATAAPCCTTGTCCAPVQKICVPEPSTKTIDHVCYSKVCEDFCVKKCNCCLTSCLSNLCGFGSCCSSCAQCEGPYAKYYLVKTVHKEECPTFKCTPAIAPTCNTCPSCQSK